MNQEAIKLIKEAIKHYEDKKLRLTGEILSLRIRIEEAGKAISKVENIKQSLEAGLERLEEADEKEGKEVELIEEIEEKEEERITREIGAEKIEDPPEQTDEERTKKSIDDADGIIAREKEREKQQKKGWKLCLKCNRNRVAPWNKIGICSKCQAERKTGRPYTRRK